jgi:hypothetical protein
MEPDGCTTKVAARAISRVAALARAGPSSKRKLNPSAKFSACPAAHCPQWRICKWRLRRRALRLEGPMVLLYLQTKAIRTGGSRRRFPPGSALSGAFGRSTAAQSGCRLEFLTP